MTIAEQAPLELDRRGFLRLGGATIAAAGALAACGGGSDAVGAGADESEKPEEPEEQKGAAPDRNYLTTATGLERAAVAAYGKILERLGDADEQLSGVVTTFVSHHEEHFGVLAGATEALGADTYRDEDAELSAAVEAALTGATEPAALRRLAYSIEATLSAHHGTAASTVQDSSVRKTALAILGSEARHVAVLGLQANDSSLPPFAPSGVGLPPVPAVAAPATATTSTTAED